MLVRLRGVLDACWTVPFTPPPPPPLLLDFFGFFPNQVGLPSIARRFSGKPVLVYGKECSMVRGGDFAELDLNAHNFSYIGRKVAQKSAAPTTNTFFVVLYWLLFHARPVWLQGKGGENPE